MEFSEQWIEQPTGVQLQAGGEVQVQEELLPPPPTATCGDQELVVKLAGIMDPPLLTGPSWSHSLQLTRQTPLELPRPTLPIMPQVTFKIAFFSSLNRLFIITYHYYHLTYSFAMLPASSNKSVVIESETKLTVW